ncbi:MAG TPA: SLC13 family permease [Pseudothermotoga sp.]|nr:SLC13 family permease [Pseudothermotoga sp.]HOK83271.1 SLC13 family permease [Pseudothermotoga sp.]HPP70097.1 SLC13 family permease [Pseudothermotoga sp.]
MAVILVVFVLIAIRRIGRIHFKIWQVMTGAALFLVLSRQISVKDALLSINLDVIVFLIGMFIIGEAMRESGYLYHLSYLIFRRAKNPSSLLLLVILVSGFLSALLMNDTVAVVGTPLMVYLARKHKMDPKALLLALAFGVTIGSVTSPIGNPQNLLIALGSQMKGPFVVFAEYLFIPTVLNMIATYFILRIFYRGSFTNGALEHSMDIKMDEKLSGISKISMIVLLVLVATRIIGTFFGREILKLSYISIVAALPVILFSEKRLKILRSMDWATIVFFASMFVTMQAVWNCGFFQKYVSFMNFSSIPQILLVSVGVSQFISNVPFVALFLTFFKNASNVILCALAAGSTIAGNLTILGAASNVIIVQNAEKEDVHLTFMEFFRVGILVTAVNVLIYWLYLLVF